MEIRETYPSHYRFLVIEGNIGAGKTSLAEKISRDYRSRLILERFAENPFLPKFYQDQERYAFPVEMAFLADRYNQLKKELQDPDMFSPMITADYYFMKSLIFAANTLAGDEYNLYSQLFHIIYASLPKPDLYVYLHQEPQNLVAQIRMRGRAYESGITVEYLQKIQNGYFDFFRQQTTMRILVLDVREIDFVRDPEHYRLMAEKIFAHSYPIGVTRVIP